MTLRKTKIVSTLGPKTANLEAIRALAKAGANVFRLNFSHGDHEFHLGLMKMIRQVEADLGTPLTVMADLQGPKYRVGKLNPSLQLKTQDELIFTLKEQEGAVQLPHPEIYASIAVGNTILINDGKISLEVTKVAPEKITALVIHGGELSSHKGVNLPHTELKNDFLTPKDEKDLAFLLSDTCVQNVDYIALSFVQRAEDIVETRKKIKGDIRLLAKVEKPLALENAEKIIEASDGILVARGDLGVEVSVQEVPRAQRRLVRQARQAGKPVIVATQMMESMIECNVPTRAEASDVANAVFEGADAVMLSAETAMGQFPTEAVEVMSKILEQAELEETPPLPALPHEILPIDKAIIQSATFVSSHVEGSAIVNLTASGRSVLETAKQRPQAPIFAITDTEKLSRQLNIVRGVMPLNLRPTTFADLADHVCKDLLERGVVQKGAPVIFTVGIPFHTPGTSNVVRVVNAGEKESYVSF